MLPLPSHLHPMVVHFPVALFITALGLDLLSLLIKKESIHQAALCIYIVAALVTPLVVRTGIWEAEKLQLNHPLLTQHQNFALWTMWVSLMSLPLLWFVRREAPRYFRVLFLIFVMTTGALVSFTGDKGGDMVFEYGVGVEQ